jgi:sulfhydrogenase subunit delta
MARVKKPKLAVWRFTSCDGCRQALLAGGEPWRALTEVVALTPSRETKRATIAGSYDVSLVEGAITTPRDIERIHAIRQASKIVVSLGACASAGGLQALRSFKDIREFVTSVCASPSYIETLAQSTAIADHVKVDFELRGCPINQSQVIEVVSAFLNDRAPRLPSYSVCYECKRRGIVCGLVAFGPPCLGPVTQGGCDALCPSYHRGCFGCFGAKETSNPRALSARWREQGMSAEALLRTFRGLNLWADPGRTEGETHE